MEDQAAVQGRAGRRHEGACGRRRKGPGRADHGDPRRHDDRGVREDRHRLARDRAHPRFKRPYTELVYQPMLELLAYLRANGFKTYIVSGGGIEFMRPWTEKVYGIPPEQVVGSAIKTKFEMRDGKPVLFRLPEIDFIDDKAGKPVGINEHIGRRPIAAFGNSDGDLQMLQWTTLSGGRALRPDRPSHRCRARIRLRPPVPCRPARQGARRGGGQQMDRRRHEEGLETHFPVWVVGDCVDGTSWLAAFARAHAPKSLLSTSYQRLPSSHHAAGPSEFPRTSGKSHHSFVVKLRR